MRPMLFAISGAPAPEAAGVDDILVQSVFIIA
jgi:hypothetical protein